MSADLWQQIRGGDTGAMKTLYQEYYQELYTYGFRIIADKDKVKDCLHEVFCELWLKRESIHEVVYVRSYLKTCVRNRILKEIAKEKNLVSLSEEDGHELLGEESYEYLLIELQEGEERRGRVGAALKSLTRMQRQIIRLKFYEGQSYEQIAAQLQLKPRTVYNHVYTAISTLRAAMKS